VVKELRSTLLGEAVDAKAATEVKAQMAAAIRGRATDPEVHRLYLHARYLIARFTRSDTTKGISYLKHALDRDPAFALAWAELAEAYAAEADSGWAPVVEGYRRAREAVAHALSLAPDLAEAHGELGWIQMSYDWDWRGAEASYRRALELAPGDATVLRRAAMLALNLGRGHEAIGLYRRAVEQDPLNAAVYANFGDALAAAGSLGEAELGYRKALELAPQRAITRAYLALNLWAQGRDGAALAEALGATDESWRIYALAIIHHGAGRRSEADAALRELIAKYAESAAYQIAEVNAARGEADHAFEWLERAYSQRDGGLSQMKTQPLLHSLHGDPRWDPFLRKMGLAD
jgi:tetratricopeptide (TPR) repeat protein